MAVTLDFSDAQMAYLRKTAQKRQCGVEDMIRGCVQQCMKANKAFKLGDTFDAEFYKLVVVPKSGANPSSRSDPAPYAWEH